MKEAGLQVSNTSKAEKGTGLAFHEFKSRLTGGSGSPRGGEHSPSESKEADRGGFCAEGK